MDVCLFSTQASGTWVSIQHLLRRIQLRFPRQQFGHLSRTQEMGFLKIAWGITLCQSTGFALYLQPGEIMLIVTLLHCFLELELESANKKSQLRGKELNWVCVCLHYDIACSATLCRSEWRQTHIISGKTIALGL